jgi:NAD+ diphosphatase
LAPVFHPLVTASAGEDGASWFLVRGADVLVTDDTTIPHEAVLAPTTPAHVLGRLADGTVCWTAEVAETTDAPDGHHFAALRGLHAPLGDVLWNVAGRAVQIVDWYRTHQYCGRCGAPTQLAPGERALRCPVDGHTTYPRVAPAVIVLVERDGAALLARSGRFAVPMYSTLAGFVEPGETLEDTVAREVHEEVGVRVDEVSYVASQPWPFPHSLMLGFTARWAGGEITVDGDEILDAAWFEPGALPMIPPPPSIARRLIDDWLARRAG